MWRMTRIPTLALASLALAPLPVLAQDDIDTVQRGTYNCELPGNAARGPSVAQPEASFRIRSASRYASAKGDGTYLRRGNIVTFSSGPRNGERWIIENPGFLRLLDGNEPTRLRCIRESD